MPSALFRHAFLAACLIGSSAVLAQAASENRPRPAPATRGDSPALRGLFDELDSNQDGKLSREEAAGGPEALAKGFRRFDKNGDGFLSYAEFAAAMSEIPH